MGQQTGAGAALVNGPGRQGRLNNGLAARTRPAWPDDPVNDKTARDVFQFFRDIFAKRFERAAAFLAGLTRRELRIMTFQMSGQWLAAVPTFGFLLLLGRGALFRCRLGDGLILIKAQLKLIQTLRVGAKTMPLVARQLVLQLLDQDVAGLQFTRQSADHLLQSGGIIGQGFKVIKHDHYITDPDG